MHILYIESQILCSALCLFFSLTFPSFFEEKATKEFFWNFFLLKMQFSPSGWNDNVLLIGEWNVCRDILWMYKETRVLQGALLIKGYSPTSLSSSSWHTPISFSALSCQVLLRFGASDLLTNTFFRPRFIFVVFCRTNFETDSRPNLWQRHLESKVLNYSSN